MYINESKKVVCIVFLFCFVKIFVISNFFIKWYIIIFRQNVFIIKTNTNELTSPQSVLKTTTVNDNTIGGNIVNIVDNKGKFSAII